MHAGNTATEPSAALSGDWSGFDSDKWQALHPRAPQPLAFLRQQITGKGARETTDPAEDTTDGGMYRPRYATGLYKRIKRFPVTGQYATAS